MKNLDTQIVTIHSILANNTILEFGYLSDVTMLPGKIDELILTISFNIGVSAELLKHGLEMTFCGRKILCSGLKQLRFKIPCIQIFGTYFQGCINGHDSLGRIFLGLKEFCLMKMDL